MASVPDFHFSAHDEFLNRVDDLAHLERWWDGDGHDPVAILGRRRVGKSWLFREFAHGKPAVVLVAERLVQATQLQRFERVLSPVLGIRPSIESVPALLETLLHVADERRTLVVIDEFPYLLPDGAERDVVLSQIQAVLEERDASRLKLVLCGSYVSQMEGLLRGPLRGRLTPLRVAPLGFADAQPFFAPGIGPRERIERYAVSGGMSAYLRSLGAAGSLEKLVCRDVLSPRAALFNDPREVLDEELRRQATTYYTVLDVLSEGRRLTIGEIASRLGRKSTDLPRYLERLEAMGLVERLQPVNAKPGGRAGRYRLGDPFMRFWFRFVAPHQEALRSGLPAEALWATEIEPALADHCAPMFEQLCRRWALQGHAGPASRVGSWWGNALNAHRSTGVRTSEEIDVVGLAGNRAQLVGECKWTARPLPYEVLRDLEQYKIPALAQDGVRLATDLRIVLFAKSGFDPRLVDEAASRDDLTLVPADDLVADIVAGS